MPNRSSKHRRRPHFGPTLFPIQTSAGDYRAWSFGDCLRWASDESGILRRDRLKLIQRARGYQESWVTNVVNKQWREVLDQSCSWWAERRRRERHD
jgi:hypothetical protein